MRRTRGRRRPVSAASACNSCSNAPRPYYSNYLWESKEAGKAREYLAARGLSEETLKNFGVGFAPSAWDKILVAGQRAGFTVAEMHLVGLVQKSERGGEYDRFRARIMFPIRDPRGRTLGFGGRATRDDQKPKYVNTSETDFFHKSEILYGLDRARAAMAKANRAVVVEGYTDVLALHQAGMEGAVGVMGTAITPEQVATLSGTVDEVVLAMDADEAGEEAMLRAQRVAAGRRMRLRVASMPGGRRPGRADDRGRRGGALPRLRRGRRRADRLPGDPGAEPDGHLLAGRARSGARRGRADPRRDGGGREPVGADPQGRRPPRSGARDGDGTGDRLDPGRPAGRARAPAIRDAPRGRGAPAGRGGPGGEAPPQQAQRPVELTSRERQERALLAMCIALPEPGADFLEQLGESHLSRSGQAAAAFIRAHPEDPAEHLPRENGALAALVTELVMMAREQPASKESMELNFLLLDQRRLEEEIAAAGERGDYERRAQLSRERAALVERIAHAQRVAG